MNDIVEAKNNSTKKPKKQPQIQQEKEQSPQPIKYAVQETSLYKKSRENVIRSGRNIKPLDVLIEKARTNSIPAENRPHALTWNTLGGYEHPMECHVTGLNSDWVLVYAYVNNTLVLIFTGRHGSFNDIRKRK